MLKATRALLSVFDKQDIVEFARGLEEMGIELLSTGGTFRTLTAAGIAVTSVSEVTGFPEILDGRVKTLHPRIHGGILADRALSSHLAQLREHDIQPIDLVIVNLYPFVETASQPDSSWEQIVEMIDIGGPTMIRAAAKNHHGTVVVVDPADYPTVLEALRAGEGSVPEDLRRTLAHKAFQQTALYDLAVSQWLSSVTSADQELFADHLLLDLDKQFEPRYGENPHQQAALYRSRTGGGIFGGFSQLHGKELSYNNLLDVDAARKLVAEFAAPTVVIVKHNNPCGVGTASDLTSAYRRALECDPTSAFGSIIATNRPVDPQAAAAMADLFVEVIVSPGFEASSLPILEKKSALRLIEAPLFASEVGQFDCRSVDGGLLCQTIDSDTETSSDWRVVTQRAPSEKERAALRFAWNVVRHVKSNAIVITNDCQTVGVGAGQMSRVDSCRIAIEKAQLPIQGCVAASDAFFPFADGLELLTGAGVTAVVQPGGSRNDSEVIAAANARGIAMMFTGTRHFRH